MAMLTLAHLLLSFSHPAAPVAATCCQIPLTDTLAYDLQVSPIGPQQSSRPAGFISAGQAVYFAARDGVFGRELWATDGTSAGTRRITDLAPGEFDGLPFGEERWASQLPGSPSTIVFAGTEPQGLSASARELWRLDGPQATPVLVKDIRAGSAGSDPFDFVALGNRVFFFADNGINGVELWSSDGTAAGTQLLVETQPGPNSSFVLSFVNCNRPAGRLASTGTRLLVADSDSGSVRLYASDGTQNNLNQIFSFSGTSNDLLFRPDRHGAVAGRTVFGVDSSNPAVQGLWSSDGTTSGTQRLLAGASVQWVKVDNQRAFVMAQLSGSGARALSVTDGSLAGTLQLVGPGLALEDAGTTPGTAFQGKFYFSANIKQSAQGALGQEPAVTDGTLAGTRALADINPGSGSSNPRDFGHDAAHLYFFANDPVVGLEPFRSDGTAPGTQLLQDLVTAGSGTTVFPTDFPCSPVAQPSQPWAAYAQAPQGLVFGFFEPSAGAEPWVLTPTGGQRLANIGTEPSAGSDPRQFVVSGDRAFFLAKTSGTVPALSEELWSFDSNNGQPPQRALPPSLGGTNATEPVAFAGGVAWSANVSGSSTLFAVWWSDGLSTRRLTPVDLLGSALELTVAGNRLFFFGRPTAPDLGRELMWSAGQALDAQLLDLTPGAGSTAFPSSIQPPAIAALGQSVVFTWLNPAPGVGSELGISDGTLAGTFFVDVEPGPVSSSPRLLTSAQNRVFFRATVSSAGDELWVTDGTSAGTQLAADWIPGSDSSRPFTIAPFGNRVVYMGSQLLNPEPPEIFIPVPPLLISDGTPAGTFPLVNATASNFVEAHGKLYFRGSDFQIYSSDGTSAGTLPLPAVQQAFAAPNFPGAPLLALDQQRLLFSGVNGTGSELWVTDQTLQGTFQLADSFPGGGSGNPGLNEGIARAGGRVLFRAEVPNTGAELHAVPVGLSKAALAMPQGQGCGSAALGLAAGAEPRLGQTFPLSVQSSAPSAPVALYFDTDLASLAQPTACALLLPLPQFLVAGTSGPSGLASFPLQLGTNPGLVGLALYLQGLVVAPGEPFLGLISLTNGLEVLIGP